MNACIKAVFATILVAFNSIALIAVGQPVSNGGVSTQTVVNPSTLPDSLPIGNEQVVLDWIVTNKQWHYNTHPISSFTVFKVYFTDKKGAEAWYSFNITDYVFNSYRDFTDKVKKHGQELIQKIKSDSEFDPSKPVRMTTFRAYVDNAGGSKGNGATGIYIKKDLGLVSSLDDSSFDNFEIVAKQVIVRIPKLERFEVIVDGDTPYHYTWPTDKSDKEYTTSDFVALQDWYSTGNYKARFKITAGGVTREYTQQGSQVLPPKIAMNGFSVDVEFALGTETIIESSTDLKNWSDAWTIPWDSDTNFVSIPYYAGSGSVITPKRFFRAKSQ
ncbi:hypothetical protein EB001_08395 [bacterium]|nr:hypothetical protein [bacterium]